MNKQIKHAFDQIQVDEAIRTRTKQILAQKEKRIKLSAFWRLAPLAACTLLLCLCAYWIYFVPVTTISIDINPSIELEVNRFDQVISATSYNTDGELLLESLDLQYQDVEQAVKMIKENETITSLLADEEILDIVVVSGDKEKGTAVMKKIQSCTDPAQTYYAYATHQEVAPAHSFGLSYGKYKAYVQLKQYDDTITPQDIQQMTMREIRDQINSFCTDEKDVSGHGANKGQGKQQGKT